VWLYAFLTSALVGGKWSISRFDRFTPGVKAPVTNWIGGWVGPRAGLDAIAKRTISHHCLCWELNPGRPARSLVSILTELRYRDKKLKRFLA